MASGSGFSLPHVGMQWVDVLALSGDSADNIPGVKGIGIKTAPNLVRAHGDIEGVLAAAPDEKKKVGVKQQLYPISLLVAVQAGFLGQLIASSVCIGMWAVCSILNRFSCHHLCCLQHKATSILECKLFVTY